jgi:membrane peptidoglycan carboxypeptidase
MMKLANNLLAAIRTAFVPALIAAGLLLGSMAVYVYKKHSDAKQFLDQIALQARNASGASFYASKKRLFVGQGVGRNEIVSYLKAINFVEADKPDQAGSYMPQASDTLVINPRLAEFQPVTIKFKRNKIARLSVTATSLNARSGEVDETTIESEPLGAFIMSIDGDEHSKMFVRRYTMQFPDFEDRDLFYAILASEDTLFMSHNGIRFDRILVDLLPGHNGGGSSITAQVVKNAVSLDTTHAVTRKVDELFLASSLEERMSKQDIIALYVNDVFLGGGKGSPNVYGFLAAAEEYFGKKEIKALTLSETCTLVAMLPKPNWLLDQAKEGDYQQLTNWRNRVLHRLNQNWPDKYPNAIIEAAEREEVRFVPRTYVDQPMDIVCRAFIDYASQQHPLVELENLPPTEYSGLRLYTSVDPELMRESRRILKDQIPPIERRFPPMRKGGCGGQDDRMLGAIVALDPRTGEIITMAGGAGGESGGRYAKFALNASDAPASTIKPFWLAKALAEVRLPNGERYTGASVIDPFQTSFDGWHPAQGRSSAGRPREKLAVSDDDFAVRNLNLIGVQNGKRFYQTITGTSVDDPSWQLALGFGAGTELSPLRLARAYTIFANNGALTEPNPISQVYLNGKEVEYKRKPSNQVIDEGSAYITTQMMRSVLGYGPDGIRGTARQAFALTGLSTENIEMGGKTGSGPNSVWMVSVSPKLVVAVLLTYQCRSEIKDSRELFSRDTAAFIWAQFMRSVKKYRPDLLASSFKKPRSVTEIGIDAKKGCRLDGPGSVKEFFIEGTEPAPCSR